MLIMGHSFTTSARLSTCIVFGNVSSQIIINWSTPHPKQETRQLIYWDAVLMLGPCQLVGANIGVIIGSLLSSSTEYIIAISVLIFANYFNALKAKLFWDKETERILWGDSASLPLFSSRQQSTNDDPDDIKRVDDIAAPPQAVVIPVYTLKVIGVFWVAYALYYVGLSQLSQCSIWYYVVLVLAFLVLIGEVLWAKSFTQSIQIGNPWLILEGDLDWEQVGYWPSGGAFCIGRWVGR